MSEPIRAAAEAVITARRQGVTKGDPTFWLALDKLERVLDALSPVAVEPVPEAELRARFGNGDRYPLDGEELRDGVIVRVAPATPASLDAALDVERLARAFDLNGVNWPKRWGDNDFAWLARQVAAEYARLTLPGGQS